MSRINRFRSIDKVVILFGNLLLLIAVSRFDVFAGPSTPDVVGQVLMGFIGTNVIILAWMLVFVRTGFPRAATIGGAAGYMAVFLVLLSFA